MPGTSVGPNCALREITKISGLTDEQKAAAARVLRGESRAAAGKAHPAGPRIADAVLTDLANTADVLKQVLKVGGLPALEPGGFTRETVRTAVLMHAAAVTGEAVQVTPGSSAPRGSTGRLAIVVARGAVT
ncbi:MAG: hypothetical protein M3P34_03415, partial [Actinomycetota bacterium]|nr:hypothetical protein [Actinomycetota bacterium]